MSPVKSKHSTIAKRIGSRLSLRNSLPKTAPGASQSLLLIDRGPAPREDRTPRQLPDKSEQNTRRWRLGAIVGAIFTLGALALPAIGRDGGNWESNPENVR